MLLKLKKIAENPDGVGRVQLALNEIGNWFSFVPFWFSFVFFAVTIALTGAIDTYQIASVGVRIVVMVGLLLISAVACATLAGLLRLVGGPSAYERLDVTAKIGFFCAPFAALPGRALISYIGETEFTIALFLRSVVHGWAVAIMVLAVLYVTRFRALEAKARIQTEADMGVETIEPEHLEQVSDSVVIMPNYMESEDHYLKIVRENSVELVRANLGEAAAKFGAGGIRCHKSYWVAHDAVKTRKRQGRQLLFVLNDGTEIPIGRSYEKEIRAALG